MTFRSRRQKALLSYIAAALGQPSAPDQQNSAEEEILRLSKLARDQGLIRSRDHVATTSHELEAAHTRPSPVSPSVEVDRLVALAQQANLSGRCGPLFRRSA
jgi:hypothetical protein